MGVLGLRRLRKESVCTMKLMPWDPDLRTIVDRIDGKTIELQPNFQRQEIWPIVKKRKLIDTILRNWSMPPVFFVVLKDESMEVLGIV